MSTGKSIAIAALTTADRLLVEQAQAASAHAYAPYSGFAVGAAARSRSGKIYVGANLENAAYGVSLCAEVAALTAANSAGDYEIEAIAVTGHKFTPPRLGSLVVTPCGRCRQMIAEAAELAHAELQVLSCNGDLSEIFSASISELLPVAFGPTSLGLADSWPQQRAILRATVAKLKDGDNR